MAVVALLTEIPPGQLDKDIFKTRLIDGHVSHAVIVGRLHQLGKQAIEALREEAQPIRDWLDALNERQSAKSFSERLNGFFRTQRQIDSGICSVGRLQPLGRVE